MRALFMVSVACIGLAGCNSVPSLPSLSLPSLSLYKMDVQQGNYVDQDMVAKLQPGMSRAQVRFVMGTPLVTDIFHADRWDYIYFYRKGGKVVEQRRLALFFEGDLLRRIEGDGVPARVAPAPVPPAK